MKNLIMALLISVSAVCAPVVSAGQQDGSSSIYTGAHIERLLQCHWLTASNENTEEKKTGGSSEEEEPDCE